jgi:hypothetical protein
MCQDCHAARAFQNSGRAYDDPHPAELVGDPLHKWKFYTREVWLRCHSFDALLVEARQALDAVVVCREALGASPALEAQKAVYDAFELVDLHYEHGVIMLGLSAGEALDDAQRGMVVVTAALGEMRAAEAGDRTGKRNERRCRRAAARNKRFSEREEGVEDAISAFRRDVAAESDQLKAALPDYQNIAPKWTVISEAGW